MVVALLIVLQPNAVDPPLVVHVRALDAPEHEGIVKAVGDAEPLVPLPTTVLAVCVANPLRGIAGKSPVPIA
jgi:hypothetical protein